MKQLHPAKNKTPTRIPSNKPIIPLSSPFQTTKQKQIMQPKESTQYSNFFTKIQKSTQKKKKRHPDKENPRIHKPKSELQNKTIKTDQFNKTKRSLEQLKKIPNSTINGVTPSLRTKRALQRNRNS